MDLATMQMTTRRGSALTTVIVMICLAVTGIGLGGAAVTTVGSGPSGWILIDLAAAPVFAATWFTVTWFTVSWFTVSWFTVSWFTVSCPTASGAV